MTKKTNVKKQWKLRKRYFFFGSKTEEENENGYEDGFSLSVGFQTLRSVIFCYKDV